MPRQQVQKEEEERPRQQPEQRRISSEMEEEDHTQHEDIRRDNAILRSEGGGSPAVAVRWAGIATDSRSREAGRGSIPAEGLPAEEALSATAAAELDCNQEEHAPAHQPLDEAVDDVTE
jgi:hypothetical protein